MSVLVNSFQIQVKLRALCFHTPPVVDGNKQLGQLSFSKINVAVTQWCGGVAQW